MADDTPTEEWRSVEGWPDYEVSNLGRVRRATPVIRGRQMLPAGYMLRGWVDEKGYRRVGLTSGGKAKSFTISRLVCPAFHGPAPTPEHEVAHSDGNPGNDRSTNLRWATPRENMADRDRHGRTVRGQRASRAKLTERQVREVRLLLGQGVAMCAIARRFGVTMQSILAIREGWSWAWLE